MRNERTDELAVRLNKKWQESTENLATFIAEIEANSNGRMVESSDDDTTGTMPFFMLHGEEQIYHFYYDSPSMTWYCKA